MSKEEKRYDIEDRLIDFAVRILRLAESLPKKVGSHIANQIIRSGTAPAAIYGEAQGAESSGHQSLMIMKHGIRVTACSGFFQKPFVLKNFWEKATELLNHGY